MSKSKKNNKNSQQNSAKDCENNMSYAQDKKADRQCISNFCPKSQCVKLGAFLSGQYQTKNNIFHCGRLDGKISGIRKKDL